MQYIPHGWPLRFSKSTSTTAMADTGLDPTPAPAPKGILLKADTVAEPFLAELKASLVNSTSRSRPPKLVGILATTNAPSRSYAEFTRKQCVGLGIEFELREVGAALGGREASADGASADGTSNGDGVEEAIIEANADGTVDGIMVRAVSCTFCLRKLSMPTISVTSGVLSNFWQGAGELNTTKGGLLFMRHLRTTICSRSFPRSKMSRDSTINSTTISITSASLFPSQLRP